MCLTRLLYRAVRFRTAAARCNGMRLRLLLADGAAKQMLGLMHRERIGADEGMLFSFTRDDRWPIWMLNMRFSIDIVWLDRDFMVVGLERSAKPCASIIGCATYRPAQRARYVLELKAGGASRYGIRLNGRLRLKF